MNTPIMFFYAFAQSVWKEIECLHNSGVLAHEHSGRDPAYALNCILYESTLRYLALRNFYESPNAAQITFHAERRCGKGPIDLVLTEADEQDAFELKRWQGDDQTHQIRCKDYNNLVSFVGNSKQPARVRTDADNSLLSG